MANVPLVVLTANFKAGASAGTAVDQKDAILSMTIKGGRDLIELPPTFARGKTAQAGADSYEVEIEYMPDDTGAATFFAQLWDALDPATNPTGEVYFEGTLHGTGAVSASNPKWSGTMIVTEAALGGTANTLSRKSSTFRLKARPTKVTA